MRGAVRSEGWGLLCLTGGGGFGIIGICRESFQVGCLGCGGVLLRRSGAIGKGEKYESFQGSVGGWGVSDGGEGVGGDGHA